MPQLVSLYLDSDQVSPEGVDTIAKLPRLETVALYGEGVDDASIAMLGQVPNVVILWLQGTHVTQGGLEHLENYRRLEALMITNLDWERRHPGNPRFSDGALVHLARVPNLKFLRLSFGTLISNEGLRQLIDFPTLDSLDIHSDQITDALPILEN